ncbi:MAG TPA: 3-phosphoshikimate 1-carboxyvinyltransferase [candidate division Zixibacteria bacterium]|nr:3-phosphoshikimate 1-carboxyvinyltransferase [candidate division Zixibacteria bacterium]
MQSSRVLHPAKAVDGSVRPGGDKSISHRYAMMAAIAGGTSKLENFSTAADCASTLGCVEALGCTVRRTAASIEIDGSNAHLKAPSASLDCGNSGSTMRMLSGILAGQPFTSVMTGDDSLRRRPMRRVMEPLSQMGARIESNEGKAPLTIHGRRLKSIDYVLPVASAQVKSCVLLAGLFADGVTSVTEPLATRDHTELALKSFGVELKREGLRSSIHAGQKLHAIEAYVPGDISSATFFLCAAAIFPGSSLIIDNVLLNPTRAVILDVMAGMGLNVSFLQVQEQHGELLGTVQVRGGKLRGVTIKGAQAAALIDELPAIAAIAPYTTGGVEIKDAKELRVKESDRIAAVAHNLKAMGVQFEESEDGLRIPGDQQPHGAEFNSFEDHRIAMAFSVAALRATGDSVMHGSDAVAVSYPEFYEALQRVVKA